MKILEVSSLSKWYGPVRGVEDLSFDLDEGEIFGYLGPNGSGKTTTLRCAMGLLRPTSGEIRIFGRRVVAGSGSLHERIGYLPGDFRCWPDLTARRALTALASIGGAPNAARRREELAERLELDLDKRVSDLSKGNRQKVGLIYAFQHDPDLLVLDEPSSGLDPLVRQIVLDLIGEASRRGATVLLSSHDLTEVAEVCRRAAILRRGRLVELGPISAIVGESERQINVWFAEGGQSHEKRLAQTSPLPSAPVPDALPAHIPGIRIIEREGAMLRLAYQGADDPVLKWLAQYNVERISTVETSLQEAFLQYYSGIETRDSAVGGQGAEVGGQRSGVGDQRLGIGDRDSSPSVQAFSVAPNLVRPESRTPSPESRSPNPESRTPSPESRVPIPEPRPLIPDPQSPIPESRVPTPAPRFPWPLLKFWALRVGVAWGLIAGMIYFVQIATCGVMHDNENVKALVAFLDVMPPMIKNMLGGKGMQVGNLNALIAIGYQHPLVLICYMLFAVGAPTAMVNGEIQRGTMELILSRRISKTQVYFCAALLTLAGMFGLALVMFLGTVTGVTIYHLRESVTLGRFFMVAISGSFLAATVGTLALLASVSFRQRNTSVAVTAAYLVCDYFIHVFARWWPRIEFLHPLSLFYYVEGERIFGEGLWPWKGMSVFAGIMAAAIIAGGIIWRKKDLQV